MATNTGETPVNKKSSIKRRTNLMMWYIVQKESGLKLFSSSNGTPLSNSKDGEFDYVRRVYSGKDDDEIWVRFTLI